jgi:hypothetical protein
MIVAECTEAGKKWIIKKGGEVLGNVERFATGFMLTIDGDPPTKIKRFRMIDALRQGFGPEEIQIDREPKD